jgi:hypothetical protein
VNWRGWLVFAVIGCAVTLACRHDWLAAAGAAGCVLLPVAWRVRGEFAATRVRMRGLAEMAALAADRSATVAGAGRKG